MPTSLRRVSAEAPGLPTRYYWLVVLLVFAAISITTSGPSYTVWDGASSEGFSVAEIHPGWAGAVLTVAVFLLAGLSAYLIQGRRFAGLVIAWILAGLALLRGIVPLAVAIVPPDVPEEIMSQSAFVAVLVIIGVVQLAIAIALIALLLLPPIRAYVGSAPQRRTSDRPARA